MAEKSILNLKSLKEQVYEYLRDQLKKGELRPGVFINMDETSKKLGVSKTPLRDALLQMEMEDFVSIIPRRGIVVNPLTLNHIQEYYEIIGSLESRALLMCFEKIGLQDKQKMRKFNNEMQEAIKKSNFNQYYQLNLKFHNIFLNFCSNENLLRIVNNLKKRLYDFPRQEGFVKQWEESSINEHRELLDLIEAGEKDQATAYIRDVHWSYTVQESYVKEYYKHAAVFSATKENLNG